ncbi:hypothetical protein [Kordia sp.]|uniref:hypothetical protein n=1 Tax=Kordia sp. TaxID=1965332 RepID=UPI003D2A32A4
MIFNKYLALIVVLVLNTFTSLQVNDVHSTTTNYATTSNFSGIDYLVENSTNEVAAITTFSPYHKEEGRKLFFDFIDNNEVEDEEPSTKNSWYHKDYIHTTFVNAELFKSSSKELQKKRYRPQSDINEPRLRLHLQFQVFII